jgi:electron transfer flavoprotein beta subunit
MKAKKKPLEELELSDIDLDEDEIEAKIETIERFLPEEKKAGRILEGDTSSQVSELVQLLRTEAKVI